MHGRADRDGRRGSRGVGWHIRTRRVDALRRDRSGGRIDAGGLTAEWRADPPAESHHRARQSRCRQSLPGRVAFSLLFLFLALSQYMEAEAWWAIRRASSISATASAYRRLWILTELIPAPVAVAIFLTGLRLLWESPARNSSSMNLWLVGSVVDCGRLCDRAPTGSRDECATPAVRRPR